jgi:hypothetical protein
MELILLSGNSAHTKDWIESVEKELSPLFESTHIQYYKHWESGEKTIDLDIELRTLSDYLKNKKDFVIFGKSAGAVLALKGVSEGKISPKSCLFTGLPVNWCDSINIPIRKWIKNFKTHSYFVQKTNDPAYGSKEVMKLLEDSKVKNFKFFEINGDDHHYENLVELKEYMSELIR